MRDYDTVCVPHQQYTQEAVVSCQCVSALSALDRLLLAACTINPKIKRY